MLCRNSTRRLHSGRAAAFVVMTAAIGLLSAAEPPKAADKGPLSTTAADAHGDPLPEGVLARLGTTRLRHGADVSFVAFGPEGKTLITAGQDNTIRLWDLASRKEVRRFVRTKPPAPKPIEKKDKAGPAEKDSADVMLQIMGGASNDSGSIRAAVTADGKTLAAVSGNSIQLWDVASGKELRRIENAPGGLAGLLFSPDSRTLAGRVSNGGLFLWAADSGKQLHHIKPARRPNTGGGIVLTFGGTPEIAPGMAFTADSKSLAAAVTDYNQQEALRFIKVWDVASAREGIKIKVPENASVSAVAISPSGNILAYGAGNAIHLCEADTGKPSRQLKTADGGTLAMAFVLNGKTLAVRGRNQRVRLFETQTGKELQKLNDSEPAQRASGVALLASGISGPEVRALAVSPDGKRLVSAAGSTIRIWEAADGKEVPFLGGHWRAPSAIVLAQDGKTAVSWGYDRVVRRWEAATGKALEAFPAPAGTALAAFSPDSKTVAFANADKSIRLHGTADGKEIGRLKGHDNGISALAFSPDGKVLASRGSGDGTIRLHDIAGSTELRRMVLQPSSNGGGNGEIVLIFGGSPRGSRGTGPGLTFSPDGRLVIAAVSAGNDPGNVLVFFDAATGKELRKIESPQPILSYTISPDGRTLAAENQDRTITLWEVASGKERGQLGKAPAEKPPQREGVMVLSFAADGVSAGFSEPGGPVGLTFSPDGKALIVRGADLTVRVWDVNAGKEIGQLKGHTGGIETVSFAPDGKSLATGSRDTTILLWDAAESLKALAPIRRILLTAAEIEEMWADLAGADAVKAREGVHKLSAAPKQSVPILSQRLRPVARADARKLAEWTAALESEKFAVRQEAAGNLFRTGEQAIPVLQARLASGPPLETRRRVEELLGRLTSGTLTTEQLRMVRSVEALERAGSEEARQVLRTLAAGAPGTMPAREAQAALARLKDRE